MNISKIIHSNLSQQSFPADYSILDNTGISYKYSPTIRSKLTNYKQVANHIDYNAKCYCAEYEQFIDINHGHVLTGKLNIIENIHIRNIMKKGLNFREKEQYNKVKAVNSIQKALSNFITAISNTSKMPVNTFAAWKKIILDKAIKCSSFHQSF